MQQYIALATLLSAVLERLSEALVVALPGARQVGKTTLAAQVASTWPGQATVFDLEVAATREALSMTPEKLLRESEGLVVLDGVQRMQAHPRYGASWEGFALEQTLIAYGEREAYFHRTQLRLHRLVQQVDDIDMSFFVLI